MKEPVLKEKILFVCHCFFNDATKLKYRPQQEQQDERAQKRALLTKLLKQDVEFIQLPCPEFLIYGSNRWGHVSNQFDTPFFRAESRELLKPYLLQLEEYLHHPKRFEILGVMGINGSPSCGVSYTCIGDWGGELSSHPHLDESIADCQKASSSGIFMQVFQEMIAEKQFDIPFFSIDEHPFL